MIDHYPDIDTKQSRELAPGVHARPFWGQKLMLAYVDFEPRAEVPLHRHAHEQAGMVIEGEIQFSIAGEARLLRAGDVYLIPGGVEHSAKAREVPARLLDIFTPLREEWTGQA